MRYGSHRQYATAHVKFNIHVVGVTSTPAISLNSELQLLFYQSLEVNTSQIQRVVLLY